ncbi:hypothetical protein FEE95_18570 [Maribacter algarum]|uniref:Threonine synthase n=1 Tax=Maribacter algarum (ex Zhang et al. 2020) TaxID=2578118 RepID=A0A5S3PI70_9FLAO|nr:DUF6503 family protein [Maribacter algarum]TMM53902.1 hypothetical protein FEE95_18570 [Maribacter algarum]
MKLVLVSLFCLAVLACKEAPKEMETKSKAPEIVTKIDDSKYPEALRKIFEAHGGLTAWKEKRTISFEIPKKDMTEKHTIDLFSRNEKIEMPGISMGSEGSDIWLLDEKDAYKGDAVFYHNLMFYFYAMPFVLADNGIQYGDTRPLEFEGKEYPGIRISYNEGVGLSSKDEYFIHYNPETYQMEWLGYTVTFRSGEKSDNIKWIRYNDWMDVEGLVLPRAITWHEYEGRTIKSPREPLNFENVTLSETIQAVDFFNKPEGATSVSSKK